MMQLEPLLRKKHEIGQQIFVRARNKNECRQKKPSFLYASYPPDELENFQLATDEDIIKKPSAAFIGDWHGLENWNGTSTRWIGRDAYLRIYSEKTGTAILSLKARSFFHPKTLEIYSGELLVKCTEPTSITDINTPFHLKEGYNITRFHVPEGCERPCDIPELENRDSRYLSLAFQNITIT